jgi:hypothetical protein
MMLDCRGDYLLAFVLSKGRALDRYVIGFSTARGEVYLVGPDIQQVCQTIARVFHCIPGMMASTMG